MTKNDAVGRNRPPSATRFRKGQSGNPAGRPRKAKATPTVSAFNIVIDRMLTITQSGSQSEVTVDEALQHKTYQDAIAGNRAARREVLKMIAIREKVLAKRQPRVRQSPVFQFEHGDPDNAEAALLLLGIASHDSRWPIDGQDDRHLLLEPWAVQAALDRRGRPPLTPTDVADVERCTGDPGALVWPRGEKR